MAIDTTSGLSAESHPGLQELLERRERLVKRLQQALEAGDLETAAILEFSKQECDGLIALAEQIAPNR
jgi:hypothetical protein